MNFARITGILLLGIAFYLFSILDNYNLGFWGGFVNGMISALGFGLLVTGKFKFWEKDPSI